jgi:hypothetical protein
MSLDRSAVGLISRGWVFMFGRCYFQAQGGLQFLFYLLVVLWSFHHCLQERERWRHHTGGLHIVARGRPATHGRAGRERGAAGAAAIGGGAVTCRIHRLVLVMIMRGRRSFSATTVVLIRTYERLLPTAHPVEGSQQNAVVVFRRIVMSIE